MRAPSVTGAAQQKLTYPNSQRNYPEPSKTADVEQIRYVAHSITSNEFYEKQQLLYVYHKIIIAFHKFSLYAF